MLIKILISIPLVLCLLVLTAIIYTFFTAQTPFTWFYWTYTWLVITNCIVGLYFIKKL